MKNFLLLFFALVIGGCQELPSTHTNATSSEISIIGQFPTSPHGTPQNALRWKATGNPTVHLFIPKIGIFNTSELTNTQEQQVIGTIFYPKIKDKDTYSIYGKLTAKWGTLQKEIPVEIKTNY